ncbi:tachylectin-related carbohydrate-binding protein [Streptomyces sp. NPDC008141]|uniref:tachylectin-related carbohydrate-binding protein n=1 Tax=Streptomyces sp. NPDC008141 TaxID=3364815 RepID=UPI0036E27D2F
MTRTSPRAHIRRTALTAALAIAVPLLVTLPAGSAQAAPAPVTCGIGPTYMLDSAGRLTRSDMPFPLAGSALPAGGVIDTTWTGYGNMLAGPGASFYGIKSDGLYYSHRITATTTWDVHHRKISTGFAEFDNAGRKDDITIDRGGYIWTLTGDTLRWNHYDAATQAFITGSGKIVASGWSRYDAIYATDKGVIYGRSATDGKLYRSRYDVTSQRWIEQHVLESAADWSDTKSMTSYGGDTLFRVKGSGAVAYYRFDEGIQDFPVYNKQVEAGGWAGYTAVSGAPDGCRLDVNHTPASPSVALENYSRASVTQSSAGSLEFAYTDNIGRLVHGRAADASNLNDVQWTTISGNEAFSGQPSLAEHTDGRVVVSAHNISGSVWQRNQAAKSSADWGSWINLAGAMAQHVVTGKTPSGLLVQFAVAADGKPWYRIQQRANVDFMGWTPLAGSGFTGPFSAVTVRDGIQLFGTNASGVLSTALFKEAGTLSSWSTLGAQGISGTPTVVVYPGYRLRVFATDGLGKVVTAAQSAEGGAYGEWSALGDAAQDNGNPVSLTADGSPSAVISPLTGLTEVVVRGSDGSIYNTGETTQGSGAWRTWQKVSSETSATEPTAFTFTNSAGPAWAYSFRTPDNQTRVYQVQVTSSLSAMRTADKAPDFVGRALPRP